MTKREQIVMLARRLTRSYRAIGEAVGVSQQWAGRVVAEDAPALAAQRAKKPAPRVTIECGHCHKRFQVRESVASRGRRFCSRRCFGASKREENSYSAKAYRLRCTGRTWPQIAAALGIAGETRAIHTARAYAKRRGLPWPVRRAACG